MTEETLDELALEKLKDYRFFFSSYKEIVDGVEANHMITTLLSAPEMKQLLPVSVRLLMMPTGGIIEFVHSGIIIRVAQDAVLKSRRYE